MAANTTTMGLVGVGSTVASVVADMTLLVPMEKPVQQMEKKMRNRYGVEYSFEKVDDNTYTIVGDLTYWRYGSREGQDQMDFMDLGFVDPSGGPFISIGGEIEGRQIVRISEVDGRIMFRVE